VGPGNPPGTQEVPIGIDRRQRIVPLRVLPMLLPVQYISIRSQSDNRRRELYLRIVRLDYLPRPDVRAFDREQDFTTTVGDSFHDGEIENGSNQGESFIYCPSFKSERRPRAWVTEFEP
jgi:hypothetical protein